MIDKTVSSNIPNKFVSSSDNYPFPNRYLETARKITQEYIESYGASFVHIDDLDQMIADALREERDATKERIRTAENALSKLCSDIRKAID